nr:MAG TPA: Protein of unknown function (DUF3139) [Bacteriophage sp.]
MKKIIISLLIIIGIVLTGWLLKDVTISNNYAENERFVIIQKERNGKVMYDKETKVEYFMFNDYKCGGGITVLVDKDGKPLIYGEE